MLLVYQKNIQDATRQLEMTRAEIMKCRAEVEASQNVASPLAALTEKKAMQTIDVDKFRTLISKLQVIDTLNTQRPSTHDSSIPCKCVCYSRYWSMFVITPGLQIYSGFVPLRT